MRDDDFGVPCPGSEAPPELWTRPHLERLPTRGPLLWNELFGRSAPIVVDLGCGNGRYLISSAIARPGWDHLGVDTVPVVIRHAVQRARRRGLSNLKFAVADAREVVGRLLPAGSVRELHVYHPQPYYDLAYVHRRLFTAEFMAGVAQALEPEGLLVVQTDNPGYWDYLNQLLPLFVAWEEHSEPWPDAPQGRTRREILARSAGLKIYRGQGQRRRDLDLRQALAAAAALPPPVFSADRRLRRLDAAESANVRRP
jgi:tRNA (guanine-N7-)-methyltransferase